MADLTAARVRCLLVAVDRGGPSYAASSRQEIEESPIDLARLVVSQAELIAKLEQERDNWMETARQHLRNEVFWRDLVYQTAEHLGAEVYVSDDGSVQDEPLGLKVPEIVGKMADRIAALERVVEAARKMLAYIHPFRLTDVANLQGALSALDSDPSSQPVVHMRYPGEEKPAP